MFPEKDYILFMALYLILHEAQSTDKKFVKEAIKRLVPKTIYKAKKPIHWEQEVLMLF